MKTKIFHFLLVFFLCLTFTGSVFAADCMAVKKAIKQERDLKKKRQMVSDAIVQCPDDPVLNYKYALTLERFRKYQKALSYYQKAIHADPTMAKAHAGMGDVYIYLGLLDKAILAYGDAVGFMPGNHRYEGRLARLKVKQKALLGEVISVGEFIEVMDHRGKISSTMELLLTGPVLQYKIAFVENGDTLQPTGIRQLAAVGQAMQNDALATARFEIATHVASADSPLATREHSKLRGMAIQDQLITNFHIDPKRLEIAWFGDDQPLQVEGTSGKFDVNERVEFKRIIE